MHPHRQAPTSSNVQCECVIVLLAQKRQYPAIFDLPCHWKWIVVMCHIRSEVLCMCDLFWEHSTTFPINLETVWVVRTCYVCHDSCWISLASLVYLFWQHISTSQALYKFITKIDVCATIHLLKVVCGFARSVASCSVRSPLGVLNFP